MSCVGIQVEDFVQRAKAAGATQVSDRDMITMRGTGMHEVMMRDPETAAFFLFFEQPAG